jgi:hypothetical protein
LEVWALGAHLLEPDVEGDQNAGLDLLVLRENGFDTLGGSSLGTVVDEVHGSERCSDGDELGNPFFFVGISCEKPIRGGEQESLELVQLDVGDEPRMPHGLGPMALQTLHAEVGITLFAALVEPGEHFWEPIEIDHRREPGFRFPVFFHPQADIAFPL